MAAADLILRNANVLTLDPSHSFAQLVAVKEGRIVAVSSGDGADLVGPGTRVVDCQGGTVLPGFNDAHCHLFSLVRSLLSIDLGRSSVRSIDDIQSAIHWRARKTAPGQWITGTGYNEFDLAEKRSPDRWDLDAATAQHPVLISHRGLHACVLNSLALARAGITAGSPDPPGAVIDRVPETGEPSGILYEMLAYVRSELLPPLSADELRQGFEAADKLCLQNGITSLQDASVSNDYSRWQLIRRLKDDGRFQPRVSMMVGPRSVPEFRDAGMVTGCGDENLRLGAVKVLLGEATGHVEPVPEELHRLAADFHRAGFQLALHAVQESCVDAAISALEKLDGDERAVAARRHRIEHCSECPPRLLKRLKKIRPVVVTQPLFVYYSGERYLATVPAAQQRWLYRIKSLVNAGLTVAASSDTPVVPNSPLIGIYAAVTRRAENGQYVLPEQGILVSQAIAAYTKNGAYASFEEGIKGSLSPGMLADMVVLSDDPTRVAKSDIRDISVNMTVIGGRVVWER